jgi:hypothetical protein
MCGGDCTGDSDNGGEPLFLDASNGATQRDVSPAEGKWDADAVHDAVGDGPAYPITVTIERVRATRT